ncbi:MAG: hypothetical protein RLZZ282_1120 [Verrucomicrobiota bacterium]
MNESAQDAWFYTHQGERVGPVTLAALQLMAQEATLNPRLDLVWTHGMVEWKPAGQIAGLFDKSSAPSAPESLAATADLSAGSPAESVKVMMGQEAEWPGARRRSFIIATMVFPVAWIFCLPLGMSLLASQLGPDVMAIVTMVAAFLPWIVGVYFGLMRLVNLGMSRWWYLANFVPILNLWISYRSFACPAGYAYHKKLDGVGIFLALIFWLFIVLGVVAMVAMVALWLGALGSGEMQEECREALRAVMEGSRQP